MKDKKSSMFKGFLKILYYTAIPFKEKKKKIMELNFIVLLFVLNFLLQQFGSTF